MQIYNNYLKIILILTVLSLHGCEKPNVKDEQNIEQASINVWHRLQDNFSIHFPQENKYVQFHTKKYENKSYYLNQVKNKAAPFLHLILAKLEERNMPGELALLPMIESSYNPTAVSKTGATGIWQIASVTAKRYGLTKSKKLDERKNIEAATQVALNYLQFLHEEFDGDWYLALAAYNAGEGRVKRAIRSNLAKNKPIDFWYLPLPKETKNFVPKLLALANLVRHANFHEGEISTIKQLKKTPSSMPI